MDHIGWLIGWFYFLSIVNTAMINLGVQILFDTLISLLHSKMTPEKVEERILNVSFIKKL